MDAETLKTSLSNNDILALLEEFQAEPKVENSAIVSSTVCHNGVGDGSHKLYYYSESYLFNCYSNCHSMDVFELVMKVAPVAVIVAFSAAKDFFHRSEQSRISQDERIQTTVSHQCHKKTESKKLTSYSLTV